MVEESKPPSTATPARVSTAFSTFRRFAQPVKAKEVDERCELCNLVLAPVHRHLLEMSSRQAVCACDPCAMRFMNVLNGRFKLIPREARALPGFKLSDAEWESFALPINLAFFFYSTPAGKMVALYPSPAGPTESLLPVTSWDALVAENPVLAGMESDVEALLVNRIGAERQYFIAPMDACYELVGLIRMHWRGLSGGEAVWKEITGFFERLAAGARG